jgi:hypothetical protein
MVLTASMRRGTGPADRREMRAVMLLGSFTLACVPSTSLSCPEGFVVPTPSLDVCLTYPPIDADFQCPADYPLRVETCDGCCAACTAVIADPDRVRGIVRGACPTATPDAGADADAAAPIGTTRDAAGPIGSAHDAATTWDAGSIADDAGERAPVDVCPTPLPPDWIFCSDFEEADVECWNDSSGSRSCDGFAVRGEATLTEYEQTHSGSRSMLVTFTENEDLGGGYVLFEDRERVFVRYFDYFDTDFDFGCGMKVARLQSFDDEAGLNHYDIIAVSFGRGSAAGERNFCGVNDHHELAVTYNGGPVDWGRTSTLTPMARGRWSCVELEARVNTRGENDGELRIWIDDTLVAERTGVNIRGSLTTGIDRALFGGWYSNGCTGQNPCLHPETPARRYIDDVVVATSRIGCR